MLVDPSRTARRGRAVRLIALAGLVTTASAALTGCAGSVETNFDSGFSVTAAVRDVPAGDAERYDFIAADLAAIAELEGVERSGNPAEWLMALTNPGGDAAVFAPVPDVFIPGTGDAGFEALGWNLNDVDRFVSYSALPVSFTVIAGELPALPESLPAVSETVRTDIEGEDFEVDFSSVGTVIDRLGRPTRFAQEGNRIAMSSSTELADSWVGTGETLADDAAVKAIASTLDGYGVMSAVITPPAAFSGQTILGPDVSPAEAEAALKEFDALVPPAPYDLVGLGWTVVDGAPRWIATYHFLSEDAAKDGAQVLRAVWEKGATLTSQKPISSLATVNDVFVKDSTVAVVLTPTEGTPASVLYDLLMRREVLFASR